MSKMILLSELNFKRVGTYTNRYGDTVTMHRSDRDSKHHLLVHKGKVVDYHHGSASEFHKKLSKDGFQGAIHEETEELNELSVKTLNSYQNKAVHSVVDSRSSEHTIEKRKKGLEKSQIQKKIKMLASKGGTVFSGTHDGRVVKEEVEQIDEISKELATNYFRKAVKDKTERRDGQYYTGDRPNKFTSKLSIAKRYGTEKEVDTEKRKIRNRKVGIDRAFKRMEEEVDQIDEVSKSLLHRYVTKAVKDPKHTSGQGMTSDGKLIHGKRNKSIKLAIGKQIGSDHYQPVKVKATEEVEPISELSTSTLTNYAIKASKSKREHMSTATRDLARGNAQRGEPEVKIANHADATKHARKAINRHEGIKKAADKLTKKCETAGVCEEIEQIDERDLSTKTKNKLSKKKFGLPGERKYPMPDKRHAANAKARATQMENKGKLSSSEAAKIRAKANRILSEHLELIEKRIRKPRHENGEIVNDPHAINKKKDKE